MDFSNWPSTQVDADLIIELENLQQVAGDETCDANEQVDDDQEDVGSAWFFKDERGWVHHGSDRPSDTRQVSRIRHKDSHKRQLKLSIHLCVRVHASAAQAPHPLIDSSLVYPILR